MGPFTLRNHRYNRTLRSGIPDRPDRLRTIDEEDDEIVDAIGEDGVRGTHDTTKDPIVSTSSIQTDMDAVTYKITYSTLSLAAYAHLDSKVWHEEALAHTPTSISSLSLGPPNISIITDSKARLLPRIRLYMLRWLTRLITRCVTGRLATARRSSPPIHNYLIHISSLIATALDSNSQQNQDVPFFRSPDRYELPALSPPQIVKISGSSSNDELTNQSRVLPKTGVWEKRETSDGGLK
ncbi:hypothetical protein MMC14_000341 [Varicellaria rhodocarpa]|nr:hypothetical protein [Varicellaria rhodocarpa]